MRILLAARRGFDYNRVAIILRGLERVGHEAYEVYEFGTRDRAAATELRRRAQTCDLIYIPPFRHLDVAWVKRQVPSKPILFDPLIGTYITRVVDFGWWWRAPLAYLRDRRHFGAADHLLFDTESHRRWASAKFGLAPHRVHTLYIGADTRGGANGGATPQTLPVSARTTFKVGFYGSLVPLQGVGVILEAARLLIHRQDIEFEVIGNLDDVPRLRRFVRAHPGLRLRQLPYLPYAELDARVRDFDICLGIFGSSLKADVVIPNKVWHYASLGRPIISRDTPGMREIFEHGSTAYLLSSSDAESLASELSTAIVRLAEDAALRERLGEAAANLIRTNYTEVHVAKNLLTLAERIVAEGAVG